MNLTTLANQFFSDKGTAVGAPPHKYTYLYDLVLFPYRDLPINFLEMGLAVGGPEVGGPADRQVVSPSVQMWLQYFSQAQIYGFDISDFSHMKSERFHFVRGDSGNADDIESLANLVASFDIIIDDASHASYHQQIAVRHLWRKVSPGGLYIIEDLHWQSPFFENALPYVPTTAETLIQFFEGRIALENQVLDALFLEKMREEVFSFSVFPAFAGDLKVPKQIVFRKAPL